MERIGNDVNKKRQGKAKEMMYISTMSPQNHKNKGFGHLETSLFTIKISKNVGFGGPWYTRM